MSSTTTHRDQIWDAALDHAKHFRYFYAEDIHDELAYEMDAPPTERTVRNTLNAMADLGHLVAHGGGGRDYREYSATDATVRECEWCDRPVTETGYYSIVSRKDDGTVLEKANICPTCISEKY